MLNIKIKRFDPVINIPSHVGGSKRSCWMDLQASRVVTFDGWEAYRVNEDGETYFRYTAGTCFKIYTGIGMELPEGFEALTAPRGSMFKQFGFVQLNAPGVVDEAYCGNGDEWFIPVFALRDGQIFKGDRFAQFRIQEKMPEVVFEEVEKLGETDRGGFGSSGR